MRLTWSSHRQRPPPSSADSRFQSRAVRDGGTAVSVSVPVCLNPLLFCSSVVRKKNPPMIGHGSKHSGEAMAGALYHSPLYQAPRMITNSERDFQGQKLASVRSPATPEPHRSDRLQSNVVGRTRKNISEPGRRVNQSSSALVSRTCFFLLDWQQTFRPDRPTLPFVVVSLSRPAKPISFGDSSL